jgi:hypothetical protein
MLVILATQEAEIRRIAVQSQPGHIVRETLSRKIPNQKKAGVMDQEVECMPSKLRLSSNPSTAKNKSMVQPSNIISQQGKEELSVCQTTSKFKKSVKKAERSTYCIY